ncbi:hypothetical protein D3C73_643430 [compost metagenome]
MYQAGELDTGNVPGTGHHALEVPDGFLGRWEVIGEETATVLPGKEAVEAPLRIGPGADVEQVDHQQVARLRAVDTHRARQVMHGGQVDIAHVAGVVVVLDRARRPVVGFQDEVVTGLDPARHRDVRVPAVVNLLVFRGWLIQVYFDQHFGHCISPWMEIFPIAGERTPETCTTSLSAGLAVTTVQAIGFECSGYFNGLCPRAVSTSYTDR